MLENVKCEIVLRLKFIFTEASGIESTTLLPGEFSHSTQSSGQKHIRGHQCELYTHILTYIFNEHPRAETLLWV